jgi:hypothetical protein
MRKLTMLGLLAALFAGAFTAAHASDTSCCKPGMSCCKPGAKCCEK